MEIINLTSIEKKLPCLERRLKYLISLEDFFSKCFSLRDLMDLDIEVGLPFSHRITACRVVEKNREIQDTTSSLYSVEEARDTIWQYRCTIVDNGLHLTYIKKKMNSFGERSQRSFIETSTTFNSLNDFQLAVEMGRVTHLTEKKFKDWEKDITEHVRSRFFKHLRFYRKKEKRMKKRLRYLESHPTCEKYGSTHLSVVQVTDILISKINEINLVTPFKGRESLNAFLRVACKTKKLPAIKIKNTWLICKEEFYKKIESGWGDLDRLLGTQLYLGS